MKTIEEVSGKDLRWYFDQGVYGTNIFDYEILDAHSDRLKWYESSSEDAKSQDTIYRNYVTVHRKGDFIFPVELAIRFDSKETIREHWDGRNRWIRYVYDRKSKLVSAEIDPDHAVWLDRNFYNNSYAVESDNRASKKLSHIWIFLSEWFSQLLAWIT